MSNLLNFVDLDVIVAKAPNKEDKVANQTAFFVKGILKQLGYSGKWNIVLVQRTKKRADVKFSVLRRQGTSILTRTKPGDNGTCWETLINPPKGYALDTVFNDLRQIRSDGTLIRKNSPVVSVPLLKPELQTEIPISVIPIDPKLPTKDQLNEESKTAIEESKTVVEPKIQTNEGSTEIAEKLFSQFRIDPNTTSIMESQDVLNKALTILCMSMKEDGSILRQNAISLLVQEMNLEEFVKRSEVYSDPVKAATIIIRGLVQKSLITRWAGAQRKQYRVRESTKGYLLTPTGKLKIDSLKSKLNPELSAKLFKPDLIMVKEIVKEQENSPEVSTPLVSTIKEVEEIRLEELFRQYNYSKKSLDEIDIILSEFRRKKKEAEKELPKLEEQCVELKAQLEIVTKKISEIKNNSKSVEKEAEEFETMKKEEQKTFNLIKSKLKKLVD